ncbi:MAG TPA: DUF3782 domain-containing protein [Chloroflexi bacterium]|nr:DUF3782 domain-containing protein [Chloroflexota bacterium]
MENQQIKQIVMRELPTIMQQDPEVQRFILQLSRQYFADKEETESRFDRVLDELRRDREENTRKWEENQQELRTMREEQNRKWEEQNCKWEANQATINAMLEEIRDLSRKHDSTIGALGARWGLYTEQSFRNALKGILEDSFGVEVINVTEFDDEGEVFGRPDQVELDVIIQDRTLILCEIKSSMSKSDVYIFERKVRFYEKRHKRTADRALVISPMVEERARQVARKLGIEVYSYAENVDPALFS